MAMPTLDIAGVPVLAITGETLIREVNQRMEQGDKTFLFFANSNLLMKADDMARRLADPDVLLVNDGIAMDLAARLTHHRAFPENLNGTDFVPALLEDNAKASEQWKVFLFGGKPGIAALAGAELARRGVQVVGSADGYGSHGGPLVEQINASGADVVLIALGNPLQERWAFEHSGEINARLLVGVGALLDFLAGDKPRAPSWIRSVRLEWAYRLSLEPTRLMRRYTIDMAKFLIKCARSRSSTVSR